MKLFLLINVKILTNVGILTLIIIIIIIIIIKRLKARKAFRST